MTTLTVVLIVIVVIAIAFAAIMYMKKKRTQRIREQFGPEYDRLARERGDGRAQKELLHRKERIEKLHIRDLNQAEIDRFAEGWRNVQNRFVDSPKDAVAQADLLIREVMTARGYPMTNFDQRAADISVDHPRVVSCYRAAHEIAVRDAAGNATTEDLRQAMVHYHSLFEELLTNQVPQNLHEVTR